MLRLITRKATKQPFKFFLHLKKCLFFLITWSVKIQDQGFQSVPTSFDQSRLHTVQYVWIDLLICLELLKQETLPLAVVLRL